MHELIQAEVDKRQRQIRPGGAGQEVRDPRPRPVPADRRADADAEGQAQRRQREVRGHLRLAVPELTGRRPLSCENQGSVRTDPTENGGLFVGRRPGTAPVRFRTLPETGQRSCASASTARSRPSCWSARPSCACCAGARSRWPACGWAPRPSTSPAASASASWPPSWRCSRSCSGRSIVLRRMDAMWILVRRAAGHDQRTGALGQRVRGHRGRHARPASWRGSWSSTGRATSTTAGAGPDAGRSRGLKATARAGGARPGRC